MAVRRRPSPSALVGSVVGAAIGIIQHDSGQTDFTEVIAAASGPNLGYFTLPIFRPIGVGDNEQLHAVVEILGGRPNVTYVFTVTVFYRILVA